MSPSTVRVFAPGGSLPSLAMPRNCSTNAGGVRLVVSCCRRLTTRARGAGRRTECEDRAPALGVSPTHCPYFVRNCQFYYATKVYTRVEGRYMNAQGVRLAHPTIVPVSALLEGNLLCWYCSVSFCFLVHWSLADLDSSVAADKVQPGWCGQTRQRLLAHTGVDGAGLRQPARQTPGPSGSACCRREGAQAAPYSPVDARPLSPAARG